MNGDIFDLGDGWLTEIKEKIVVAPPYERKALITKDANIPSTALYKFNEYLESLNIDFLYIQAPYKISRDDKIIGVNDHSNENADELLKALSLWNIPCLDLRNNIGQENLNHHNLFYRTDNHWRLETGLWAAGIIASYLNNYNNFSIDLNLFYPNQYRTDIYKDIFLGCYGRKVTLVQTNPEDITLIYPIFDTDVQLKIPSRSINRIGLFDIFYNIKYISNNKVDYNQNTYGVFLDGDNPVTIIHNNMLHDNKKILIIKDSFCLVLTPFLSVGIENVEMLDLRYFTGSVKTYIEESIPDIVVVMYNPFDLDQTKLFNFR